MALLPASLFLLLVTALIPVTGTLAHGAEKVLVVFSGKSTLSLKDGKSYETGFYLVELATPLAAVMQAGFEPVYASPTGARPVMDKLSDVPSYFANPEEHARLKALVDRELTDKPVRKLADLTEKDLAEFRAVFLPGGHAPMEDLYRDRDLGKVLRHFHRERKPTALICHAPVALLAAEEPGRAWIYKGYRMTVFSNAEEAVAEKGALKGTMKFYAETALKKAGGRLSLAKPWSSQVVRDRELITGQNPMSDQEFAKALVGALAKK